MKYDNDDEIIELYRSVTDAAIVIIPEAELTDEEFVMLFKTVRETMLLVEKKVNTTFDVGIESASYFDGFIDEGAGG